MQHEIAPRDLTSKGLATRRRILDTALAVFRERGFDGTTMRSIAARSGVSLGSAYYYFPSKEHLILGYYETSHREHLEACGPLLAGEDDFAERLSRVVRAKIDTSMPYHRFAGALFKTAADPQSPLSPFSPESAPVRADATSLLDEVVSGSSIKVSAELAPELPKLLWVYLMGVILFWIHDQSPQCRRTYRLIDATVPVISRLVSASRFPVVRELASAAAALSRELGPTEPRTA